MEMATATEESGNLIRTLVKNKCCVKIELITFRLWDSTFCRQTTDAPILNAVCIDEEGNAILLVAGKEYSIELRNFLEEGCVYEFQNLDCVSAPYYRPVARAECLRVNSSTKIEEEVGSVGFIKKYFFEFQTFQQATGRLNLNDQLTDLIGLLSHIEDTAADKAKFGEGNRTKFYLEDLIGNKFPVVLWGNLSQRFRRLNLTMGSGWQLLQLIPLSRLLGYHWKERNI